MSLADSDHGQIKHEIDLAWQAPTVWVLLHGSATLPDTVQLRLGIKSLHWQIRIV